MDSSILLEDSGVIHDPTVGWGFTIQWPKSLGFSSCRTLRVLEAFLGFKVFRDSETEVICQPSHFQCCAHGCCPQVARAPQQNGYLGSHAYLHSVPLSWRKQIHWILRHDLVDEKDKMSSCQHFWSKYKQTYIYIVIAFCFVYLHQFDFVVFIYSTGINLSKHQQNGNTSFQPLKSEHVGVPHAPRYQCCQSLDTETRFHPSIGFNGKKPCFYSQIFNVKFILPVNLSFTMPTKLFVVVCCYPICAASFLGGATRHILAFRANGGQPCPGRFKHSRTRGRSSAEK